MHLLFGTTDGNSREARRRYREFFPNRRLPNHQTFAAVDRCMRDYSIRDVSWSWKPQLQWVAVEDNILQLDDDDLTINTQCINATVGISQTSVWCRFRDSNYNHCTCRKYMICYLQIILDASSSVIGYSSNIRLIPYSSSTLKRCTCGHMRIHTQLYYEGINVNFQWMFGVVLWTTTCWDCMVYHRAWPVQCTDSLWCMSCQVCCMNMSHSLYETPCGLCTMAPLHISVSWPGSISMLHIPVNGWVMQDQLLGHPAHRT